MIACLLVNYVLSIQCANDWSKHVFDKITLPAVIYRSDTLQRRPYSCQYNAVEVPTAASLYNVHANLFCIPGRGEGPGAREGENATGGEGTSEGMGAGEGEGKGT